MGGEPHSKPTESIGYDSANTIAFNNSKKISVIVPVFNVEKWLPQCIDSIIKQTYKNLEIILVDDESPDKCPQICDDYAARDNRIKVIHKQNQGLAEARNTGIDAATANYISHVDSDDFIHSKMYEILMNVLEQTDADISYGGCKEFHDDWNIKEASKLKTDDIRIFNHIEAVNNLLNYSPFPTINSWGKLYKKSLYEGIRYPAGEVNEDAFTTYKLLYHSKKVAYVNEALYYHRIRVGSITQTFNLKRLQILNAYKEQTDFLKEKGLDTLYSESGKFYLSLITTIYCEVKKAKMDTDILRSLKERFYFEYKRLNVTKDMKFDRQKFKIMIYYISPPLFELIFTAFRKVKKQTYMGSS